LLLDHVADTTIDFPRTEASKAFTAFSSELMPEKFVSAFRPKIPGQQSGSARHIVPNQAE